MSAYSQAANGFVVSDRVTLMLNTLDHEARKRILARAYDVFFKLGDAPLTEPREEQAAKAVVVAATEIAASFKRRQRQSREARRVGAELRETADAQSHDGRENISRPSHDGRETAQERREEKGSPTPPIKEESKETSPQQTPHAQRFVPPGVEEVRAYCEERKNGIDAQSFIDFYTAKGWKIGSNGMKDWRAAVRNWETRRRNDGWTGRGAGFSGRGNAGTSRAPTAGNFRGGTADQRAEADAVL